jgi:hypothetical protein
MQLPLAVMQQCTQLWVQLLALLLLRTLDIKDPPLLTRLMSPRFPAQFD